MRKTFMMIASLLGMVLAACTQNSMEDPELGWFESVQNGHLIQMYRVADDFELEVMEASDGRFALTVNFLGERMGHKLQKDSELFHSFAEKYNDCSYPKDVIIAFYQALSHPLESVKIVADQDYDTDHPKGTELAGMATFCASSPYDYIQSGYTRTVPSRESMDFHRRWRLYCGYNSPGDVQFKPIEIPAGDVNTGNSHLLWPLCHLWFKEKPRHSGPYTFTVTLCWDGKTVSKQLTHTF